MDLREVLESHRRGDIDIEEAERLVRMDLLRRVGDHTVFDLSRSMRRGIPEVVMAGTKTSGRLVEVVSSLIDGGEGLIVMSRVGPEHRAALSERFGDRLEFNDDASMAVYDVRSDVSVRGTVGIMTAGTSDIPVAEEAAVMARCMGCEVIEHHDVGVAAIHRLLGPMESMVDADVIIVVAGMEGALASVVASMAWVPVIGVPTSTGYGHGGDGEGALMTMLQSCSPGLVVVNIDNGIGAGTTAALIARR